MNEQADEHIHESLDEWINASLNGWMNRCINILQCVIEPSAHMPFELLNFLNDSISTDVKLII